MSIETIISNLTIRVATEVNNVRRQTGALASLSTTNKASIVAAINELKTLLDNSTSINDAATGNDTTWSSEKVLAEINAARDALINGAPGALDTLNELATALRENDTDIVSILRAQGRRVRTDTARQGLSSRYKSNARINIGAAAASDLGDPNVDLVALFENGLA